MGVTIMPEFVLGTGRKKTVRVAATVLCEQVFKVQGPPRKITARAEKMEFSAERPGFEGEFESFTLRIRATKAEAEALRATAETYADVCSISEEMGCQVIDCPPVSASNPPPQRVLEAVDALCACTLLPEIWRVQGENFRVEPISAELIFQAMIQYKASDVHFSPGDRPIFRIDTQTRHSELLAPLSGEQILDLVRRVAPEEHWQMFERNHQCSFGYHQIGMGYARVSAFLKMGAPHCTFRFLPEVVPSFEALSIPPDTIIQFARLHRGLVLITGMTGSGKTTTAAAMIDWINANRAIHIITIEDPIEYVHENKKSIISQRCLGVDVNSFAEAVVGAMRHDPDVIMLGEMRDSDTVRAAIIAASTGHLVISTLHSNTASEVVNRIVSFFDPVERDLVKLQLRDCMRCIICQRLVPRVGVGRIPALEVLLNDIKPLSDAILDGDTDNMRIGMQQTTSHSFLFEDYLYRLYKTNKIDLENAREYATEVTVLDQMIIGTYSVPRLEALKAARDASQRG